MSIITSACKSSLDFFIRHPHATSLAIAVLLCVGISSVTPQHSIYLIASGWGMLGGSLLFACALIHRNNQINYEVLEGNIFKN